MTPWLSSLLIVFFLTSSLALGRNISLVSAAATPPCKGEAQTANAADAPCSTATTTAQMLDCESKRLDQANADLNRVYGQLMRAQNSSGKQQLKAAETAWLRFRDADAAFHASVAADGTLAPVLRITSQADATKERISELQKMLH